MTNLEAGSLPDDASFVRYTELAKACRATYAAPIKHSLLTYRGLPFTRQKIVHGSLGRGFCRVFSSPEAVIVAFRGTREAQDWSISNFRCLPVRMHGCPPGRRPPLVHRGFQNALYFPDKTTGGSALAAARRHVQELGSSRKLIVTGHSLGGAIAQLFALKMALADQAQASRIDEVVTFGAPAVGFRGLKKLTTELGLTITRLVNGFDAVPFTPPAFYRHLGSELWLFGDEIVRDGGWPQRFSRALRHPRTFASDHSIDRYIEQLSRRAKLSAQTELDQG